MRQWIVFWIFNSIIMSGGQSWAQDEGQAPEEYGVTAVYDDETPSPLPTPSPGLTPAPSQRPGLLKRGVPAPIEPKATLRIKPGPSAAPQVLIPNKLSRVSPRPTISTAQTARRVTIKKCLVYEKSDVKSKPISYVDAGAKLDCVSTVSRWCQISRKGKVLYLPGECF